MGADDDAIAVSCGTFASGRQFRRHNQRAKPGTVGRLLRQALERNLRPEVDGCAQFDWMTLALLFCGGCANHAQSLIIPALAESKILLCDRYDSI